VIARVPVVLFQAVLAALLPKLASLAAKGEFKEFAKTTWGLLATVAVLGVVAVLTAVLAGKLALSVLFGSQYHLERADFAYLSGASIVYIVALTLGQALVALRAYSALVVGWIAGVLGFAVAVSLVHALLLRVEIGFLTGSAASAAVLGVFLIRRLAAAGRAGVPALAQPALVATVDNNVVSGPDHR